MNRLLMEPAVLTRHLWNFRICMSLAHHLMLWPRCQGCNYGGHGLVGIHTLFEAPIPGGRPQSAPTSLPHLGLFGPAAIYSSRFGNCCNLHLHTAYPHMLHAYLLPREGEKEHAPSTPPGHFGPKHPVRWGHKERMCPHRQHIWAWNGWS